MDRTRCRFLVAVLVGTLLYAGIEYQEERLKVTGLEKASRQDARMIYQQQTEISALRKELDAEFRAVGTLWVAPTERATPETFLSYDNCFGTDESVPSDRRYLASGLKLLNEGLTEQDMEGRLKAYEDASPQPKGRASDADWRITIACPIGISQSPVSTADRDHR